MRLTTLPNWVLLCSNAVLLGMLLLSLVLSDGWQPTRFARCHATDADADMLNMDLYLARGPFRLYASRGLPYDQSFWLIQVDRPNDLTVLAQDETDNVGNSTRHVILAFGEGHPVAVTISCTSSPDGAQKYDLTLSRDSQRYVESFSDWGAVGSFDLRHVRDFEQAMSRRYVFYEGNWVEEEEFVSKYQRVLVTGEEVVFDQQAGRWIIAENAAQPQ